jgi:Protein of unknown function (DUF2934)
VPTTTEDWFGCDTQNEEREEDSGRMTQQGLTSEQIAARAYQLYLERGRTNGYDLDDWLQAEYELRQLPVRKLAEMEPPPAPRGKSRTKSLIELVRAAMY